MAYFINTLFSVYELPQGSLFVKSVNSLDFFFKDFLSVDNKDMSEPVSIR